MPFLNEITGRLIAAGVGTASQIGESSATLLPNGDGAFLTVAETGGSGPARTQNDTATQRPTAQLMARAGNYPAARTMLKKAYDALGGADGLYNITLSGTFYLSITARQEPTDTGLDSVGRATVSFNIDAEKQPS